MLCSRTSVFDEFKFQLFASGDLFRLIGFESLLALGLGALEVSVFATFLTCNFGCFGAVAH